MRYKYLQNKSLKENIENYYKIKVESYEIKSDVYETIDELAEAELFIDYLLSIYKDEKDIKELNKIKEDNKKDIKAMSFLTYFKWDFRIFDMLRKEKEGSDYKKFLANLIDKRIEIYTEYVQTYIDFAIMDYKLKEVYKNYKIDYKKILDEKSYKKEILKRRNKIEEPLIDLLDEDSTLINEVEELDSQDEFLTLAVEDLIKREKIIKGEIKEKDAKLLDIVKLYKEFGIEINKPSLKNFLLNLTAHILSKYDKEAKEKLKNSIEIYSTRQISRNIPIALKQLKEINKILLENKLNISPKILKFFPIVEELEMNRNVFIQLRKHLIELEKFLEFKIDYSQYRESEDYFYFNYFKPLNDKYFFIKSTDFDLSAFFFGSYIYRCRKNIKSIDKFNLKDFIQAYNDFFLVHMQINENVLDEDDSSYIKQLSSLLYMRMDLVGYKKNLKELNHHELKKYEIGLMKILSLQLPFNEILFIYEYKQNLKPIEDELKRVRKFLLTKKEINYDKYYSLENQ